MDHDSTTVALAGALLRLTQPDFTVLLVDPPGAPLPPKVLYQGELSVRFAFALLYEADHFVPERVIDDFRRQFDGILAYQFLIERGDSFPRADVIGTRVSTGQYGEIFVKQLDLAAPLVAIATPAADTGSSLAQIDAVIWIDDAMPAWSRLDRTDERCRNMLSEAVDCYRLNRSHLPQLKSHLSK